MFADHDTDEHDWEAELHAGEERVAKEAELRLSLERARDAGHERRAAAIERLLAALEED